MVTPENRMTPKTQLKKVVFWVSEIARLCVIYIEGLAKVVSI